MYLAKQAPFYFTGLYVDIGCWCVELILVVSMGFYLRYLNKKQEARRVALGLPAGIKDMSIMSTSEADAYKEELTAMMAASHFDMAEFNAQSFDDMTDFQSVQFHWNLKGVLILAQEPVFHVCLVSESPLFVQIWGRRSNLQVLSGCYIVIYIAQGMHRG